ncbi:MAG: hypothetical protein IKF52_00750 [Clostridia bacterium]|nr:hypothetical protein [Clostridia bacterium]
MKRMIFNVTPKRDFSIPGLLREINKISCSIELDFANDVVDVKDVSDELIDSVCGLIDSNYEIAKIQILNQEEEKADNKASTENSQYKLTPLLQNQLKNLLKITSQAVQKEIEEKDLSEIINSATSNIYMNYFQDKKLHCQIGDIVNVNFGAGLPGEICGEHIKGIVLHILGANMAYVVPIVKKVSKTVPPSPCVAYNDPNDAGIVLYTKGRYVRFERINSIGEKVSEEFLRKLQNLLLDKFDFNKKSLLKSRNNKNVVEANLKEEAEVSEKSATNQKKFSKEEEIILSCIEEELKKIDGTKKVNEAAAEFLKSINLTIDGGVQDKWLELAIVKSTNLKKITSGFIIDEIQQAYPKIKADLINVTFRKAFRSWLENYYPEKIGSCGRLAYTTLFKLFKEYYNSNKKNS